MGAAALGIRSSGVGQHMKGKVIEAKPVIDGEKVDARLPPRLPETFF
jgi:hypothetical protein